MQIPVRKLPVLTEKSTDCYDARISWYLADKVPGNPGHDVEKLP